MSPNVLTVTLSPAVDYATSTERVVAEGKLYCRPPLIDPGGGGVNVARVMTRLGGSVSAFAVVGGAMGDRLLMMLDKEGVRTTEYRVQGETRYSLAVRDEATGEHFRFSLPREPLNRSEANGLLPGILKAAPQNGFVVLSGGVAPGLDDTFPQDLQAAVSKNRLRFIVDTSKAPLMQLIHAPKAPLDVLRLDRSEVQKAVDKPLRSVKDNLAFGEHLVRRGVAKIVVTGHGAEGSAMVCGDEKCFCHAPKVEVLSKIGAGDAFVGAFTFSLAHGDPPEMALKWGVAAAAATVGSAATALCDRSTTEALLPACRLVRL